MTPQHFSIPQLNRIQQKGLFLFSILILGFMGFQYWGMNQNFGWVGKPLLNDNGITIELNGKVYRPGLVIYPQPPTVQQVIQDAGGLILERSLSSIEGARILAQDSALTVMAKEQEEVFIQRNPLSGKALWILGRPIPLNRAALEDLDRLPRIGPGLARRIIEYREANGGFSSLDELKEVKGIKEKTFEKIKNYLTLS